jgi:phage/plasmid-like protein (TIGR03299 family)
MKMAHEVESLLYVGETPWHGLGTRFIEAPTLDEAIVAAGLDWKVTTEPVLSQAGEILPALATRRSSDGRILGVVGPSYTPLQNLDAFKFFHPFIEMNEAQIETAGSLRMGQRVFILAKLKLDPMEIVKGDAVQKYVLLSNSHDGTLAVRVGFTPIRVVCANTMALAINSKASQLIRVRHTKNVVQNLEDIREIMNLANAEFEATAEQYRLLAAKDINQADLEKYVKLVFNTNKKILEAEGNVANLNNKRILNSVQPLFEKGRGNDLPQVRGTLWAAYNAVTEYLQYERGEDKQVRLDQMWFGQSAQLNKRALDVGVMMAAAA